MRRADLFFSFCGLLFLLRRPRLIMTWRPRRRSRAPRPRRPGATAGARQPPTHARPDLAERRRDWSRTHHAVCPIRRPPRPRGSRRCLLPRRRAARPHLGAGIPHAHTGACTRFHANAYVRASAQSLIYDRAAQMLEHVHYVQTTVQTDKACSAMRALRPARSAAAAMPGVAGDRHPVWHIRRHGHTIRPDRSRQSAQARDGTRHGESTPE